MTQRERWDELVVCCHGQVTYSDSELNSSAVFCCTCKHSVAGRMQYPWPFGLSGKHTVETAWTHCMAIQVCTCTYIYTCSHMHEHIHVYTRILKRQNRNTCTCCIFCLVFPMYTIHVVFLSCLVYMYMYIHACNMAHCYVHTLWKDCWRFHGLDNGLGKGWLRRTNQVHKFTTILKTHFAQAISNTCICLLL